MLHVLSLCNSHHQKFVNRFMELAQIYDRGAERVGSTVGLRQALSQSKCLPLATSTKQVLGSAAWCELFCCQQHFVTPLKKSTVRSQQSPATWLHVQPCWSGRSFQGLLCSSCSINLKVLEKKHALLLLLLLFFPLLLKVCLKKKEKWKGLQNRRDRIMRQVLAFILLDLL